MKSRDTTTQRALFWKAVIANGSALGVFGGLLSITPAYSDEVALAAAAIAAIGVIASAWAFRSRAWWLQLVVLNGYFLLFLGFGIRAGAEVFPGSIIWPISLVFLYLFAWAIPWLLPHVSGRIAAEQLTPTTPLGRGCLIIALGLVPAAGALSYLVSRLPAGRGFGDLRMILIAVIFSAVAVGGSQAFSHQYWQKRPWAKRIETTKAS